MVIRPAYAPHSGDPCQVYSPPVEFDDEQHVQPGEPHRLHSEEVTREHAGGLRLLDPSTLRKLAASTLQGGLSLATLPTIDAEELYRLLDGVVVDDVNVFNARLKQWQDYYNYDRPHGGLNGQTPYERLRQKTQPEAPE